MFVSYILLAASPLASCGSGKPDTRFRNLFVLKHIWVKVSITFKFQPNWSKNTLKSGFFRISGKSGSRIRNFFSLKPSRDQDGANKKRFSQIGPAVPELLSFRQTDRQKRLLLCIIDNKIFVITNSPQKNIILIL